MGYDTALKNAWMILSKLNIGNSLSVRFLADQYSLDFKNREVISFSCNAKAKDFVSVLVLHYVAKNTQGLPPLEGRWHNFKELSGIEGYQQAFRNRVIEPAIRKYGSNPAGIFNVLERLPARKAEQADAAVVVEVFDGVPVLVELWAGDEEFGPEANMLFDGNITDIFCIEDIIVMGGFLAASL